MINLDKANSAMAIISSAMGNDDITIHGKIIRTTKTHITMSVESAHGVTTGLDYTRSLDRTTPTFPRSLVICY